MTSLINASTSAGVVITPDTSGVLALQTAGITAVSISAAQNVGIGTASPANPIQTYKLGALSSSSNNIRNLAYFQADATTSNSSVIFDTNPSAGQNLRGFRISYQSPDFAIARFHTDQTTGIAVDLNINSNGNLALLNGTTTANGVGITFPATQSASSDVNCLDDYEEGTWTPSVGGTASYTQQVGEYTKIGRIVYLRATLQINVLGTGSTTTVTGIPFNGINKRASGSCGYYGSSAVNVNQLTPIINSTNMTFVSSPAAGTVVTDSPAIFGNGTYIFFNVTYET